VTGRTQNRNGRVAEFFDRTKGFLQSGPRFYFVRVCVCLLGKWACPRAQTLARGPSPVAKGQPRIICVFRTRECCDKRFSGDWKWRGMTKRLVLTQYQVCGSTQQQMRGNIISELVFQEI